MSYSKIKSVWYLDPQRNHQVSMHCVQYTFHWPISVTGQIMRFPPLVSEFLCLKILLKPENFTVFLEKVGDWSEIVLDPPSSRVAWLVDWLPTEPPLSECVSRRDMVIIVFPSPMASAKIFRSPQSNTKIFLEQKETMWMYKQKHTPPLAIWRVLGNSVVASPENEFKYITSPLL